MDLSLSAQQQLLQNAARDFVRREAPKELIVDLERRNISFASDLWRHVAALGWLGSVIPREYGGEGTPLLDTAVIYEELGRGPVPGPFFESAVLCALVILEAASAEQKQRILPAVAEGTTILSLAALDPSPRWGPEAVQSVARRRNGGYVVDGTKAFVQYPEAATSFLVACRTEGGGPQNVSLFIVDGTQPGVAAREFQPGTMTGFGEVALDNVDLNADALLGEPGQGWDYLERALLRALPIICAYQVGGLETVTDLAISYSQSRVVFGQPIGRFQRVQDRIVEAANHRDAARWTTYEAIWKVESGRSAAGGVHLAKAITSEGYYEAVNLSTEVHAGIGIESGTGLNAHIKMSRGLYSYLGDPRYHRRRMLDAFGL